MNEDTIYAKALERLEKIKKTTTLKTIHKEQTIDPKHLKIYSIIILCFGGIISIISGQLDSIIASILLAFFVITVINHRKESEVSILPFNSKEAFKRLIIKPFSAYYYPSFKYSPNTNHKKYAHLPAHLEDIYRATLHHRPVVIAQVSDKNKICCRIALGLDIKQPVFFIQRRQSMFSREKILLLNVGPVLVEYENRAYRLYLNKKSPSKNLMTKELLGALEQFAHQFSAKTDFEFSFQGKFLHLYVQPKTPFFVLNKEDSNQTILNEVSHQIHLLLGSLDALCATLNLSIDHYKAFLAKINTEEKEHSIGPKDFYEHLINDNILE